MAAQLVKKMYCFLVPLFLVAGCSTLPPESSAFSDNLVNPDLPPLPIETTGKVAVLPEKYPSDWVLVDDSNFFSMLAGKMIVLDVVEPNPAKRIKGIMDKSMIGNFGQSALRNEFYIIESFHERGSRGKKTEFLVFYDKTTLSPVKELLWPTDRLTAISENYAMTVSGNERFLFVANFTPAASFTVVDLDTREIIDTIATPGCVLTYPTGKQSVSSLCSNGGILTTVVGDDGKLKSQHRLSPFFDTDDSPIFERPVIIDGIAYFPGFQGEMHVVDMTGEVAVYLEQWSLVNASEQKENWRPSGIALNDADEQGRYYVIMQPNGAEGTQTHGGTEIWVYDMMNKKRLGKIPLPGWGISLAVTAGSNPKVVVTNAEMNLDVFYAEDGSFIHTISDFGNVTPLLIYKAY